MTSRDPKWSQYNAVVKFEPLLANNAFKNVKERTPTAKQRTTMGQIPRSIERISSYNSEVLEFMLAALRDVDNNVNPNDD